LGAEVAIEVSNRTIAAATAGTPPRRANLYLLISISLFLSQLDTQSKNPACKYRQKRSGRQGDYPRTAVLTDRQRIVNLVAFVTRRKP